MSTPPLGLAVELAHAAGAVLSRAVERRAAGADLRVRSKSTATDLVSEADHEAEQVLATLLAQARPDDGLLGEEGGDRRPTVSGYRWVVDPLDGTVNLLHGRPVWSVSVACEDADGTLLGVVHQPSTGETFTAERGHGAELDGRPLALDPGPPLAGALVATGFSYQPEVRTDQAADLAALLPVVADIRRDGSAALDLAWIAAGRHHAYLEFGLAAWDWAAGTLIVEEAGGRVSTHERVLGGRRLRGLVAGAPTTHAALAAWLAARP